MPFATLLLALLLDDPTADLQRFPPAEIASYSYLIAKASLRRQERELLCTVDAPPACFVVYATPLALNSPERAYRIETLQMTRHCMACWLALSRAANHPGSPLFQRAALDDLRALLGESDWAAGQMPPCVPWWRFGQ